MSILKSIEEWVISAIIATFLLAVVLSGCDESISVPEVKIVSLEGNPLSAKAVSGYSSTTYRALSIVIEVEGNILLCYSWDDASALAYASAAALVESEILDGDEEIVEVTGYYKDAFGSKILYLQRVRANGYTIDF